MNRIKTSDNGGFGLVSDDLRFWSDGAEDAMAQSNAIKGNMSYIISGLSLVTISGSTLGNNAGIAVVNGELCYVDAELSVGHDIIAEPYWYLEKVVSYDSAGFKVFEDTSTHDTYEITKAQIVSYATVQVGNPYPIFLSPSGAMLSKNKAIANAVADELNVFSQTQSWGRGAASSISGGFCALGTDGNSFDINIAANDTLSVLQGANLIAPGTQIIVRFVGSSGSSKVTINNSGNIITPNGADDIYRSGDCVTFVALSGSTWQLVTEQGNWPWVNLTNADMLNGFTCTNLRYRLTAGKKVVFEGVVHPPSGYTPGTLYEFYTMPVGLRPTVLTNSNFAGNTSGGAPVSSQFLALATGNVYVGDISGGVASVSYLITGHGFYLD